MSGNSVLIDSGDAGQFSSYLARPSKAKAPGVVMVQEIYGVTRALRAVSESFACQGFLVAAPDLFWRIEKGVELEYTEREKAHDYMNRFDTDTGVKDIGATVKALRDMPECNGRVAVMGYCLGGTLAYLSAARLDIDGAVSYYGTNIQGHLGEAKDLRCALVLHFADKDHLVVPETVQKIRDGLEGSPATLYTYPDVGHAFCRDTEPKDIQIKTQASKANERTFEFLSRLQ